MNNKFPKLNLEKFAHDEQSFYEAIYHILVEAENYGVIKYILTDDINLQYAYSDKGRKGYRIVDFLKGIYLTGDKETLLSFLNEIIPNITTYLKAQKWEVDRVHKNLNLVIYKIADIIVSSNNPNVFNVDFYYDEQNFEFKRKLDEVTIQLINSNGSSLDGDNKIRYQECVADFLSYKSSAAKNKLFYNESLNKLKKVIENTLQNNFKRSDGAFPKIHEKKQLSNILFDNNDSDFENFLDYVIKNIHHENGGQPKNFTEKEYVYLWLALNNILYLLNRYSENKLKPD